MNKKKITLLDIHKAIYDYMDDLGYSVDNIVDFICHSEILIDSGWECSETGFVSVWIDIENDRISLVNAHEDWYEENVTWDKILDISLEE